MHAWHHQFNEAIDAYHTEDTERALELFQLTADSAMHAPDEIAARTWMASCLRTLQKYDQAEAIINDVLDQVEHSNHSMTRALHVLADIYQDTHQFEKAFAIYHDLIERVEDYEQLQYLDMRLEQAMNEYDYFTTHGTVEQWKQKLRELISSVFP